MKIDWGQSDCTGYKHELHRNVAQCKYVICIDMNIRSMYTQPVFFFFPLTGQQNLIKCNFYSPKNNLLLVKKWAEAALKYIPEKKQYQEKSQGVMLRMFSSVTASFNLITHPH